MDIQIESDAKKKGIKTVIYGPEGIGKTTLAWQFPFPLFMDTEGSTHHYQGIRRINKPNSFEETKQIIGWCALNTDKLQTFVIDSGDWLDKILIKDFLTRKKAATLGSIPFGKGHDEMSGEFKTVLELLDTLIDIGINVTVVCHYQIKTQTLPDDMGSYDRYELKMEKKHAALLKEWADLLIFCNYKTNLIYQDSGDKKAKAVGGQERVMYMERTAAFDAKNRFGLPAEAPLDFKVIEPVLFKDLKGAEFSPEPSVMDDDLIDYDTEEYEGIPEELIGKMMLNQIKADVIEQAALTEGWVKEPTKFKDFEPGLIDFINQTFQQFINLCREKGYQTSF